MSAAEHVWRPTRRRTEIPPDVTLYRCPALAARITAAQCGYNGQRAQGKDPVDRVTYECCLGCPGVVALAGFPS